KECLRWFIKKLCCVTDASRTWRVSVTEPFPLRVMIGCDNCISIFGGKPSTLRYNVLLNPSNGVRVMFTDAMRPWAPLPSFTFKFVALKAATTAGSPAPPALFIGEDPTLDPVCAIYAPPFVPRVIPSGAFSCFAKRTVGDPDVGMDTIRLLPLSLMYKVPSESTATAVGPASL